VRRIYSPAHGELALTVPLFDGFMKRAMPESQAGERVSVADGVRMEFRIADTLTDSLGRQSGEEEKAVKTTVSEPLLSQS
jgi:hypothetical protein